MNLGDLTGTWNVRQRMWTGAGADPIELGGAVATRRLLGPSCLLEEMVAAAGASDFVRLSYLNENSVTGDYEYVSFDTRAPQTMLERGPVSAGDSQQIWRLQGGTFLAPEWGEEKNVTFRYRLELGREDRGRQRVRLLFTSVAAPDHAEFVAFEYEYQRSS